jgi:hypothetical protein
MLTEIAFILFSDGSWIYAVCVPTVSPGTPEAELIPDPALEPASVPEPAAVAVPDLHPVSVAATNSATTLPRTDNINHPPNGK